MINSETNYVNSFRTTKIVSMEDEKKDSAASVLHHDEESIAVESRCGIPPSRGPEPSSVDVSAALGHRIREINGGDLSSPSPEHSHQMHAYSTLY